MTMTMRVPTEADRLGTYAPLMALIASEAVNGCLTAELEYDAYHAVYIKEIAAGGDGRAASTAGSIARAACCGTFSQGVSACAWFLAHTDAGDRTAQGDTTHSRNYRALQIASDIAAAEADRYASCLVLAHALAARAITRSASKQAMAAQAKDAASQLARAEARVVCAQSAHAIAKDSEVLARQAAKADEAAVNEAYGLALDFFNTLLDANR